MDLSTLLARPDAVVELVAEGRLPAAGFVRQEDIALADLISTHPGRLFADHGRIS